MSCGGLDAVMVMYLGRVSGLVLNTASVNLTAASLLLLLLLLLVVTSSLPTTSRQRSLSSMTPSWITTCSASAKPHASLGYTP